MPTKNDHLKVLQGLKEAELQEIVLAPLFRGAFRYDFVDPYGGNDEHGIDLICWKKDELDEIEVAVVQVKRFKPARSSSSQKSFVGLINQVSQATERRVPHSNGHTYLPRTFYFVTPYPLDNRTLETRFEKVASLRQHGLKIIDGTRLLNLIEKHLPDVARRLFGGAPDIHAALMGQLNNSTLLGAIKCSSEHHIVQVNTI